MSFTDSHGEYHNQGSRLTSETYRLLTDSEKLFYEEDFDAGSTSSAEKGKDDILDDVITGVAIAAIASEFLPNDTDTPSSSSDGSSFVGFGGGDFGGGGASSDW